MYGRFYFEERVFLIWSWCRIKFHGLYLPIILAKEIVENKCHKPYQCDFKSPSQKKKKLRCPLRSAYTEHNLKGPVLTVCQTTIKIGQIAERLRKGQYVGCQRKSRQQIKLKTKNPCPPSTSIWIS